MTSTVNVDLLLESSEFFAALDDKLKTKFKTRLLKRLNKKFDREFALASLADISVTDENVNQLHKHISTIFCFSWLGLIFGPLWAAYHKVPFAVAIVASLFLVAWPVMVIDHGAYLELNRALSSASSATGVVFAMYGRSWLISHQISRYLEIRFPAQSVKTLSSVWLLGTGITAPWLRVLFLIAVIAVLAGIEVGLETYLYG